MSDNDKGGQSLTCREGLIEGRSLGRDDGLPHGCRDGRRVGLALGCEEGRCDGCDVGVQERKMVSHAERHPDPPDQQTGRNVIMGCVIRGVHSY